MKRLSLEIKSFFRSKTRLMTFIAFFAVIIGLYGDFLRRMLAFVGSPDADTSGFHVLFDAQEYGYYFFIFFILISYWLFSIASKSNLEETLRVTKKSIRNVYLYQFIFLVIISLFVTLTFTVINLVSANLFGMLTGKYAIHIILVFFLNFFLTDLLAIIIGFVLSGIKNRPVAYLSVVVVALLSSDLMLDIVSTLNEGFGLNIYPVARLFTLFTPNMRSDIIASFGVSILPYRWEAVLLWCFLFSGFAVYRVFTRKNTVAKSTLAGFLALSVICAALGLMPQSKVIRDYSPDQVNFGDTFYYLDVYDGTEKDVPADFSILKYDMKLKVRNTLNAEVTVAVDDDSLKEYPFTLHHGFKVKEIKDASGNPLKFEQNIDLVTVYPQSKTQAFTFIYNGFNPRYYSNMQGVCLPANCVYYPVAGNIVLHSYTSEGEEIDGYSPETVCDFTVEIDYYQKIYSNLKSDGDNRFSGKSNGFSMVAGFYDEVQIDGVNFIYPTLRLFYCKHDNIKKVLKERYKDDMDLIRDKTFVILPNLNQGPGYNNIFKDHFIGTPYGLDDEIKALRQK